MAVALASVALFTAVSAVGLDTANLKFSGSTEAHYRQVARDTMKYVGTVGVGLTASWGIFAWATGFRLGLDAPTFMVTLALCPAGLLILLLGAAEMGRGHAPLYNAVTIVSLTIYAAGVTAIVSLHKATPSSVLATYLVGNVIAAAILVIRARKAIGKGNDAVLPAGYWPFAARAFPPNVAQYGMLRCHAPAIQMVAGVGAVGIYSVAMPFGEALIFIPIAISVYLIPEVANQNMSRHGVVKLTWLALSAAIVSAVIIAITASILIPPLYGQEFHRAIYLVWTLLPGVVAFSTARIAQSYFAATDRPAPTFVAAAGAIIATIAGIATANPRFGIVGIGVAISAGYLLYAIIIFVAFIRLRGEEQPFAEKTSSEPARSPG